MGESLTNLIKEKREQNHIKLEITKEIKPQIHKRLNYCKNFMSNSMVSKI